MSVTLSTAMSAAVSALGTAPGWLLELGGTLRLSSLGDVSAMGLAWTGCDLAIDGLLQAGNLASSGTVRLGDADGSFGAMLLLGELSDVTARVWVVDRAALAADDPVLVFSGRLDEARSYPMRAEVVAQLVPGAPGALQTPRLKLGPEVGITVQLAAGTTLRIGGTTITIEDALS